MPDDEIAGLSVVVSAELQQAMKALEKLSTQFEKTAIVAQASVDMQQEGFEEEERNLKSDSEAHEQHSAGIQDGLKKGAKAWAVMGAVATGTLYGIIKASSYASIYTAQFGATVQQLANHFMEETGLNKAIEDFLSEFQVFTDNIAGGDSAVNTLLKSLKKFKNWFGDQSLFIKFVVVLGTIVAIIGLVVGVLGSLAIAGAAVTSGWGVVVGIAALLAAKFVLVKAVIAKVVAWFAAGSAGALVLAAAIGAMIGLIMVWLMKKTGIMDWFAALGEGFREWDSWIKDIILIIEFPLLLLGAAINDIVNGDFGFPLLKKGLVEVGDAFGRWEDRVLGVVGTIISKVQDLIRWIRSIPSTFGGIGGSSSPGTSISPSSMPGGGDYSSHQFGGPVMKTGLSLVHAGEYVVPKGGAAIGGGGNTYNIAPIINITTAGGVGMANDISRQVSKAIAEEVKRISKV